MVPLFCFIQDHDLYFPLSVKDIVRDPFDPAGRIDREISDRNRRLAMGTCLTENLRSISSALVVATGKGKYLRILSAKTVEHELPEYTSKLLQVVARQKNPSLEDLHTLQADIAAAQAATIEELKCSAGKYVDRLLVVSVTHPDHLLGDLFRRTSTAVDFSNANVLSESTGLSVVNSFASRDVLAGGTGKYLEALPAWILFADRDRHIASKNRVLFLIGKSARAYFLPASDGIEHDLPGVRMAASKGLDRFDNLNNDRSGIDDLQLLNLDGNEIESRNFSELRDLLEAGKISLPDFVRSSVVDLVGEISQGIKNELPAKAEINEIVVHTDPAIIGTIANQFRRVWPNINVYNGFGWDASNNHLQPILTATLGILSIDQLPANVPWITGASSQKVLGKLTPGSPTNWRQLLREMADFQPPVMRLRDAV